jgi:hypothetical protein
MIHTPVNPMLPFIEEIPKVLWKQHVVLWILITGAFALGFRLFSPSDRMTSLEQDHIVVHRQLTEVQQKTDSLQNGQDAILSLLCVNTTTTQHRLARVKCP